MVKSDSYELRRDFVIPAIMGIFGLEDPNAADEVLKDWAEVDRRYGSDRKKQRLELRDKESP